MEFNSIPGGFSLASPEMSAYIRENNLIPWEINTYLSKSKALSRPYDLEKILIYT